MSLCVFVIALNRVAANLANGSCKSDFGTGRLGYCLFVIVRNFIRVIALVAIAAITSENRVAHFCTSGGNYGFGVAVIFMFRIVCDIFLSAVGAGVDCISVLGAGRLNYFALIILMGIQVYLQFCSDFFVADTADLDIVTLFITGCIFMIFHRQLMSRSRNHTCRSLSTLVTGERFLPVCGTGCRNDHRVVFGHVDRILGNIILVTEKFLCSR